MNKQELNEQILKLESELQILKSKVNEPEKQLKTKEERFIELMQNSVLKIDKENYPDSIFGMSSDSKFLWEYDIKNRTLWLSYERILSVLETEYSLAYLQIQALTESTVEEHFKCDGITTGLMWPSFAHKVEEHFKCKKTNQNERK